MKKLLTFLMTCMCVTAAFAAPPSDESIRDLLQAMKAESLLESMYGSMDQTMKQTIASMMKNKKLNAKQQFLVDDLPEKMTQLVRQELTWEKLLPMYSQIYSESFTQEEVNGLVAFYRSPAGQAYVNKLPVVAQKTMRMMGTYIQPMQEKVRLEMGKAMAEIMEAK